MSPRSLSFAGALALCACATTPAPKPAASAQPAAAPAGTTVATAATVAPGDKSGWMTDSKGRKYRIVCTMERATGSNIAEKTCRPELEGPGEGPRYNVDLIDPNLGRMQNKPPN